VTVLCLPRRIAELLPDDLPDGVRLVTWNGRDQPVPADCATVDLLVPSYMAGALDAATLVRFSRLRAIQLLSAGYDGWPAVTPAGVRLCNGSGIHGGSTAELAVAGISALLRDWPRFERYRAEHQWRDDRTDAIAGKHAVVVGAGDIGRRIGTALEAFGAEVSLVGRTAREGVHWAEELPGLRASADIVVLAAPLTEQTRGLVDAGFLAGLRDGAILVNIARGGWVDTGALVAELNARRLRAVLDVTDPEPLPAGHALWDAPNLVLTPHIGGGTTGWDVRSAALVADQVRRLHAGEPLRHVVHLG
jgi:phosphoglycerate dehydrogenase-like enzyme